MMGAGDLFKKFKNFMEGGAYDEDDWDYPEGSEKEQTYTRSRKEGSEYETESEFDDTLTKSSRAARKGGSNVVDFESGRTEPKSHLSVVIVRPTKIEEAAYVCDYLRDNKLCIINMHEVDHQTAQRIADYLGGVSYALKGQVERIDSHIFVMGPEGSKITADLKEGLRSGELFARASR